MWLRLRRAAMIACLLLVPASLADAARVEVVLYTDAGGGGIQVQDWYRVLSDLKVDSLQIRGAQGGEKVEIVKSGTGAGATYRVSGLLTSRNEITLPSGRFKLTDRARLSEWLNTLRNEGAERALGAPRPPFGIPPEQLKLVRDEFTHSIDFDTKGLSLKALTDRVGAQMKTPLVVDPAAAANFVKTESIRDEMKGLATGVALAAALRPAGLVLVPRLNAGKQVELGIAVPGASNEFWPIGWAPTANRPEREILPALHEIRDVELDEVPVMDLVGAIAERLKTPVLMDHNGLARQGLEPDKVKVSMPSAKSTYSLVLGRMLVKAKLKYEIRIDDAGKPFIWIMSYI